MVPWPKSLLDIDYAISTLRNCFDIIAAAAALYWIGGCDLKSIWRTVGLSQPARAACVWAILIFLPATLFMLAFGSVNANAFGADTFFKGLFFPMFEEIGFRGLAIGALLIIAGWRLWQAALIPSVFFGIAHAIQGDNLIEASSLAAITGAGGLLGGWLYQRWNYNLWPPFFLHAGLNILWMVFDLGENAIGGWLGNGLRLAVVLAAIGLTAKGRNMLERVARQPL
jgi:hypothetical protein